MKLNWKTILLWLIIVIAVGILIYYWPNGKLLDSQKGAVIKEEEMPMATGDIDASVDAIIHDSLSEQADVQSENDEADASLDSEVISDFGTSYNENEL